MHGPIPEEERARKDRGRVNPAQLQTLRIRLCFMILVVDCLAIFAGCLLGNYIRFHDPLSPVGVNLFAAVLPLYVGIAINSDAYAAEVLSDVQTGLSRAILGYIFAVFAVFFLAFYMKVGSDMSRMTSGVAIAATFMTLAIGRYLHHHYVELRTGGQLVYDLMICDEVECPAPPPPVRYRAPLPAT